MMRSFSGIVPVLKECRPITSLSSLLLLLLFLSLFISFGGFLGFLSDQECSILTELPINALVGLRNLDYHGSPFYLS